MKLKNGEKLLLNLLKAIVNLNNLSTGRTADLKSTH